MEYNQRSVTLFQCPRWLSAEVTCTCEAVVRVQIIKNHAKYLLNKAQQMKKLSIKSSPTSIYLSSSPTRPTNFPELMQPKVKRNKNRASMALGNICLQCLLLHIIDLTIINHEREHNWQKA